MFPKVAAPKHDELVPDPQAQRELNITAMTMWRWDRDQTLIEAGWPPPIRIRNRKFRSRQALEEFKSGMARRAIAERAKTEGEAAAPETRIARRRRGQDGVVYGGGRNREALAS